MKSTAALLTVGCLLGWALIGAAPAAQAAGLDIGDPAPALQVTEWVKGEPVDLAKVKDQRIVVVEFWATWCGPCVASVPHLTELQKRFGDQGVTIIGITSEDPDNTLDKVKKFVEQKGKGLGYTIAFDKEDKTGKAFMEAAGEFHIPTAFVVNKQGRIAWIGFPDANLDRTLENLLAGKHDIVKAREVRRVDRAMQEAVAEGKWDDVLTLSDELIAVAPELTSPWQHRILTFVMGKDDPEQGLSDARRAVARFNDDAHALASLADLLLGLGDDRKEFLDLAAVTAQRAAHLAPEDLDVRMVQFGALASTGKFEEAQSWLAATIDRVKDKPEELSSLAEMVAFGSHAERFGPAAVQALDYAIAAEPSNPQHDWAKLQTLGLLGKDIAQLKATGRQLLSKTKAVADAALLNEVAWVLLTEEPYAGKLNELAIDAAQRCHELSEGQNWMYLDTLALAYFENGKVKEAIETQKKAIERCSRPAAVASLQETLQRYEHVGEQK